MPYEQKTQMPQTQKTPSSNPSKTAQAGNDIKKGKDRMENEGGNRSSSDTKSAKTGTR